MAFKFVVLLASVMVTSAVVLPSGILQPGLLQPGILQPTLLAKTIQPTILAKTVEPLDTIPKYTFSYQVNDPTTGDVKSQEETRDGDVVKGAYALIDPDGLQRVVQYTSDAVNGFNAIVSRTPLTKQVAVAPAVPVIKTLQPTLIKSIPSIIQSPIAKIGPVSPLIRASPLGVPLSPLGLPLIG